MTTLSRYIFRQALGTMLLILLSLTGVVWIALALRQLNLMTSQGQDALVFLKITLLGLPSLMAVVAPVALLIAAIQVLNRMNGDSELIVMTAGGSTIWGVARPLFVLASVVFVMVVIFNVWVMPWSSLQLRASLLEVRTDLIAQVIQPGRFTSPEKGLTLHIRDRARDGELLGLVMHDSRDEKQVITFLSDRARIVKQDGEAYLVMQSGQILRREKADEPAQIIEFQSYAIDLARLEPKAKERALRPRERTMEELFRPPAGEELSKRQLGQIRAELHERLSSPLYPFAFALLALALVGQARTTRQSRVAGLVAAFVLATAARVAGLAGTNLVALRASAVPIVYLVPIATAVLAALYAHLGMQARGAPAWLGTLREAAGGLLRRLPWRGVTERAGVRP